MLRDMRPTPAKSHYQFNLRDLSKIFQGLLMTDPKKCQQRGQLARSWVHECRRIFCDRLINDQDRNWFHKMVRPPFTPHTPHKKERRRKERRNERSKEKM